MNGTETIADADPIRTLPLMTATLIGYARHPTDRQVPSGCPRHRRSASGTRRETGPRPDALRPGRSHGQDVLQYPRHLRGVRGRSHPDAHPRGHGHRPRQGQMAGQAAQTVRPIAVETLPHACHRRVFHQRSRRVLLRIKTNRLSHTQPTPFPLSYDSAPYRNRPTERHPAQHVAHRPQVQAPPQSPSHDLTQQFEWLQLWMLVKGALAVSMSPGHTVLHSGQRWQAHAPSERSCAPAASVFPCENSDCRTRYSHWRSWLSWRWGSPLRRRWPFHPLVQSRPFRRRANPTP